MKMYRTTWLACAAGLLATLPASGQELKQGTWETSLGIDFLNSSNADFEHGTSASFDSDSGFRAAIDYSLTDALQVGASFGIGQRSYKADIAGANGDPSFGVKGDLDYSTLLVTGTYNLLEGPFRPFVTAGVGWSWVDTNIPNGLPETGCWWDPWYGYICAQFYDTRSLDGFTYQLGIGARYDFSDMLAVHASYRINWIDFTKSQGTPDFDGFDLSIGFKF